MRHVMVWRHDVTFSVLKPARPTSVLMLWQAFPFAIWRGDRALSVIPPCVAHCLSYAISGTGFFFFAERDIESSIPIYTQLMIVDVPPLDINGKGCPVTGIMPTATIILNRACTTSSIAIPMARNAGKVFTQFLAIVPTLKNRTT